MATTLQRAFMDAVAIRESIYWLEVHCFGDNSSERLQRDTTNEVDSKQDKNEKNYGVMINREYYDY